MQPSSQLAVGSGKFEVMAILSLRVARSYYGRALTE